MDVGDLLVRVDFEAAVGGHEASHRDVDVLVLVLDLAAVEAATDHRVLEVADQPLLDPVAQEEPECRVVDLGDRLHTV